MPTTQGGQSPAIVTGAGAGSSRPSKYEAPYVWDGKKGTAQRILSWVTECVQEGDWFLRGQMGYQFVDTSYRIMTDKGFVELPETLSKVSKNFVKRDVRELVGTLANPRPIASYLTENQKYLKPNDILNKGYLHWNNACFSDRKLRKALQYAAEEGTGYLIQEWDPSFWEPGQGDVREQALGVDSVLPIQISPEDWDLQTCYAVVIRREFPVFQVRRRFPLYADMIFPDGDSPSRWRRFAAGLMDKVVATVQNTYGSQRGYRGENPAGRHLTTVYDIYILDGQRNMSDRPVKMGVPESPWEYTVPYYKQEIPIGIIDPATGSQMTRPANLHDCAMFPYRRHLVCTKNVVLYDGPSRWWHGKVPIVKFVLDDDPHEYCGMPVSKDPAKLQAMLTSILRAFDDSVNARLRPPLGYDGNRTSKQKAEAFDPRKGGQTFQTSNVIGETFKMLVDPRYYDQPNNILEIIKWIEESGAKLMGLHDLIAMSKAAQIPGADTIEKLSEMAGPVATDMSRNMEEAQRFRAELFKGNFFEFYTIKKRFQIMGQDGITREDFDYDPASLVPSDIDLPIINRGGTRSERARIFMRNFHYYIVPNSIYQMTQSSRRLLLLQLARFGMPIPPKYLMEQFDLPNPEKLIQEFWAYKADEAVKMTEIQILAQSIMAQMSPMGQVMGAMQQGMKGGGGNPQGEGRPPTGQQPPHMEPKDGGTRMAISES